MEDLFEEDNHEQEVEIQLSTIKKILGLEQEIKNIKKDIKEIWSEAKDQGVDVKTSKKALAEIKKLYKIDKIEMGDIKDTVELFKKDVDIHSLLVELVSK